ncbi:ribonuclease H-like domain-containing protein [Tanacetum coccineum]
MLEYSQKWHNRTSRTRSTETSDGLATIEAQLSNLGREIKKVNEKVYAAQVGCELCKGPHYTKDCTLKKEGKTLEETYYTQFGAPFLQGGQYQSNNANPSYQERRQSMEESLSKFITESAKIHKENSNLIKEIRASTDAAIRNQGSSIKAFRLYAYSIGTTLRNNALPRKEKDPRSFTLPCYINSICFDKSLADLGASVSVMPLLTYLNLGLGKLAHTKLTVELADRKVKHPKGITENVLVEISKFVFLVDFIILDIPEDINVPLIFERPFCIPPMLNLMCLKEDYFKDYIELSDLNEPLELRRNRDDDLEPTVEEGKVVNEPMMDIVKTRCDFIGGLDDYPIVKDMDPYLDEGMGDVIVGEPFCKATCVEAKRFDGIITIHDEDDSVTYQMV